MEEDKKIEDQNEWARKNIEWEDRMPCLVCGRIVHVDWMKSKIRRKVGARCAPCYFGHKRKQVV